jgi:hypothetical protein
MRPGGSAAAQHGALQVKARDLAPQSMLHKMADHADPGHASRRRVAIGSVSALAHGFAIETRMIALSISLSVVASLARRTAFPRRNGGIRLAAMGHSIA